MSDNTVTREWIENFLSRLPLMVMEDAINLARAHLALLDKLDAERERNAELEAQIRTEFVSIDTALEITRRAQELKVERDRALSELAEARNDTERLDWLANNSVSIAAHQHSNCSGDLYVRGKQYRASTLRAAIDAACAAIPKEKKD